jgi:hypothetical protein
MSLSSLSHSFMSKAKGPKNCRMRCSRLCIVAMATAVGLVFALGGSLAGVTLGLALTEIGLGACIGFPLFSLAVLA